VPAGSEVVVSDEGIEFEKGLAASAEDSAKGYSVYHRIGVDFQGAAARRTLRIDWDSTSTKAPAVRKYDPELFQLVNP